MKDNPHSQEPYERQHSHALDTLRDFLQTRDIQVERYIVVIENYIIETEYNDSSILLNSLLERITENLLLLEDSHQAESMIYGLVEMLSIFFQHFEHDFDYGSILRQLLTVCAAISSCIWQTSDIESLVLDRTDYRTMIQSEIAKDIRNLQRFASSLHEIERAENIFERDLNEMKTEGKFCEELDSYEMLRESARSDVHYMKIYVKVRILQITMLWQMYAVAKLPGHSDKIAHYLHHVLSMQKAADFNLIREFLDRNQSCDTLLIRKYFSCLHSSEMEDNLHTHRKRFLLVVPLLEKLLKRMTHERSGKFTCIYSRGEH